MTIELSPDIEAAVAQEAKRRGTTPEEFVRDTLREKLPQLRLPPPVDEWHARLRAAAVHVPNANFDVIASRDNINGDYL